MTPDEIVRPSAADLAAGRDPVLALGIALAGGGTGGGRKALSDAVGRLTEVTRCWQRGFARV